MYAHSLRGAPAEAWEPLSAHLSAVASLAADFAAAFGWPEAARAAGLLHDIGKVSGAYQAYIATPRSEGTGVKGPDHSTAGARAAIAAFGPKLGRMLACAIAGHHAGLGNGEDLDRRLGPDHRIEPCAGWQAQTGPLPPPALLRPTGNFVPSRQRGFSEAFLTRMLFSCLVDADFLATEAFYEAAEGRAAHRGGHASIETLRDRLRTHMAGLRSDAEEGVNALRAQVLEYAVDRAALPSGLFTLTVPTGGGKTLASLSFALEHAARHRLRRVVYVIPFTSIIEQTAAVFREALSTEEDVLEHHANFDWPEERRGAGAAEEGPDGLAKLRRAAENWDVPVVVTTAVQFFESLFANRPSRCRKLHNLAGSVIVLDEAQTLPLPLLRPCMAALDELARNYHASVVLCTATQPALRRVDGFEDGFEIDDGRELAPEPKALYAALKRVRVEVLPGPVEDATVATRFAGQPQMLCIVNSRAHARALFEAIRHLPGAIHLSTLMVPRHRREVLAELRRRLRDGQPVRIVSTSLIEAGVDIDLPEVWRAAAGLDSIAQAAGRCNRNGKLAVGRVVVFEPATAKPPRALEAFWQATRPVLRGHDDLLGLDAVRTYFQELYWQKGSEALDALELDGRRGVLSAIAERAGDLRFPFRNLAEAFRLIDDVMEPVVVPWDEEAARLLQEIGAAERSLARHLRKLQQYTVSIPRQARDTWLRLGALRAVHPALGEGLLAFEDAAHYRAETGLDLGALGLRAAESNVL
ncbi:CRISPR-associated endonuclease Cas3'' [Roseicella aquatilis]|uniref:CRISPR-associated endonuclease Cas3 n=1 Tax=Roseicella aquatilis TaxID=2527868 RepID=A0A4R4D5X4_9PROT|nr:CRISPR-associated endonuclease Cas3'' [Roseicella aquatilis]TCZ53904.1 CRISPR-associated endonuclease Cas3'' [Roseicella aquatilis]